jgi:hypothetical protein
MFLFEKNDSGLWGGGDESYIKPKYAKISPPSFNTCEVFVKLMPKLTVFAISGKIKFIGNT